MSNVTVTFDGKKLHGNVIAPQGDGRKHKVMVRVGGGSDLQNFLGGLFSNTLRGWQWAVLAAVPPLIVLLYFLKLNRHPLEFPSTYLWSRTIEDLHVNSIWQSLRHNLLLFLQLLLIALVMLVCLRPGWRGTTLTGSRFVFLIDRSASMSATDVAPSRLAAAKAQAISLIDQMKGGDVAMVISFADEARVEQEFTSNRRLLPERVEQIQPSSRASDLRAALRAAAGLANTGRSCDASSEVDEHQGVPVQVERRLGKGLRRHRPGRQRRFHRS